MLFQNLLILSLAACAPEPEPASTPVNQVHLPITTQYPQPPSVAQLAFNTPTATAFDLDPPQRLDFWVVPQDAQPEEEVDVFYAGPLQPTKSLTLRYGFDGWVPFGEGYTEIALLDLTTNHYLEAPFTFDGHNWAAKITLPKGSHALHAMVYMDGDDANMDDLEGLQYHWGLTFPYIGPYLTLTDEVLATDGAVVTFETNTPSLGLVRWGSDPENLEHWATGETIDTLHHIPITGRQAGAKTYYQVSDNLSNESPIYAFTTASNDNEPWSLLVMADQQDNGKTTHRWREIAEIADQDNPDSQLIFAPGDLSNADYPGYWWIFFDRARALLSSRILVPVLGNHDTPDLGSNRDTSSFRRFFDLPKDSGSEEYYAIQYNNALFLTLNTEDPEQLQQGGVQYEWAEGYLASMWEGHKRAYDWVFVGYHHPSYDAGIRFANEQLDYRAITELFDGNVDLVFTGHEHLYQRFSPLQFSASLAHSYGAGPEDGVGYIVVPPAGNESSNEIVFSQGVGSESRNLLAFPELSEVDNIAFSEQGYIRVDLSPKRLQMSAFGVGNLNDPLPAAIIDLLTIDKQ
jgi:hypothetical protein